MPNQSPDFSPNTEMSAWATRSFGFVTLWSARESEDRVLDWLATAEVPPQSALYWVDNSGGRSTAKLQQAWAQRLQPRFRRLVWIEAGDPYRAAQGEDLKHPGRHQQVARLYSQVFARVWDEMVVTLEDDTVPPADGLRSLLALYSAGNRVAAVAGVYRDRINPARIAAARHKHYWQDIPVYDALPAEPFEVGMTGAGFTLIVNRALQQVLPLRCIDHPLLGFDANMGRDFTALGYRVLVHPGVRCAHLCPEVIAYEATRRARAGKLS